MASEFDGTTVDSLTDDLRGQGYIADRGLATTLLLALKLGRPILLEGEVGVGKTELARTLATMLGRDLIRLQCYEGIDMNHALYEWDYARQMLFVRSLSQAEVASTDEDLFGERFLVERPLLKAVRAGDRCVLLIDEVDRADDEFEAFLLELLSDFQVTIPEVGTIAAETRPIVILTSNRTREVHDALKRRCLYRWIGYPERQRELDIVAARAPEAAAALQTQAIDFVHRLRGIDLFKAPGIAEAIDWCRALAALGVTELDPDSVRDTLGVLLKYQDDLARVDGPTVAELLAGTPTEPAGER